MNSTTVSHKEGFGWRSAASCADETLNPEFFFELAEEDPAIESAAKRVCASCPVREACLENAMIQDEEFGIFGGMTPSERARHRAEWLRQKGRGGSRIAREAHGVVRRDAGVERKYLARTEKASHAVKRIAAATNLRRRDDYLLVLDMVIANPCTNMTMLAQRLGKSRPWFEGMFREACAVETGVGA